MSWTNPDTAAPGITGAGTTLSFTPKGGSLTKVGTIQDMDGPGDEVGEVESTRLASVFKPYTPTIPEAEMSFTFQFAPGDTAVQALRAMTKQAPVPIVPWVITYPDGSTDSFSGYSKGTKLQDIENESIITGTVGVRLTTPVTWAAAPTQGT